MSSSIQISARRAVSILGCYYVLFLIFAWVAHRQVSVSSFELALLTAWLGAVVGIVLVFTGSRLDAAKENNRWFYALILAGLAVDGICNFPASKLGAIVATNTPLQVLRWMLLATGNLGVLTAAIAAGLLVARGLQKPNYLVMAAIVGAVTDIFSVYAGPSKHIVSSEAFMYFSYQWGVLGEGVIPCVGAGDFIFLSLYFVGARRFELSERKTLVAMIVAFGLGFLSLLFSPSGIPALPFMAALLLLVHGRELKAQMKRA
jgi:hypothetical protein